MASRESNQVAGIIRSGPNMTNKVPIAKAKLSISSVGWIVEGGLRSRLLLREWLTVFG